MNIDWDSQIIYVSFDYFSIDDRHSIWRQFIRDGVGTDDISPNPYWTFEDIEKKLNTKLNNLMYVTAETKWENGQEYFRYNEFEVYVDPH